MCVSTAQPADADELAALAAKTFPLACPPSTAPENIASHIAANLSVARFAGFLIDPACSILAARHDSRIVGYAMLVRGNNESAELSKLYVSADYHGLGVSTELMNAALAAAVEWGADRVWLGVNQKSQRAQRFYAKHGFEVNDTRTFRLGAVLENDYIMIRQLHQEAAVSANSREVARKYFLR